MEEKAAPAAVEMRSIEDEAHAASAVAHTNLAEGDGPDHEDHENPLEPLELARIALVAAAAALVWFRVLEPFPHFSVIGILAVLIGGYPIFHEALSNVVQRRMTMELSMTIALVAAMSIGQFFTALVIAFFVLVAEVIEGLTVGRGRQAIKKLIDFLPQTATVRRDGTTQDVSINDLGVEDIVVVKPGSRLPVDGVVVSGTTFIDQATITGESMPVEKEAGARVFAGTINQSGTIDVRTTHIGRDTAFGRIMNAVEDAERSRAPVQKLADRYAGYLVYFALACAVLTFLITRNATATISVIIVAGACGIAAGTPLAVLGAIGRAAREGAIIKGGLYLEILSGVDTVVFDKTGTVTLGNPEVTGIDPLPGETAEAVLEAAAIAERPSEHPLGKAILARASQMSLREVEPEKFNYQPGKGITCTAGGQEIVVGNQALLAERHIDVSQMEAGSDGQSAIFVARGGKPLGTIRIADVLRPEAADALRQLRQMGLRTMVLTGDRTATANAVAKELGVDEVVAELLPDQKLERIRALLSIGRKVAMVGDGINDAPALMEASVGVAMGSGTDVARESANVVLLGNDLLKFVETVRIARRCRSIITFNFVGTLIVDAVGVGLAAFGMLSPLLAVLIHVISELTFILNSARLLPGVSGQSGANVNSTRTGLSAAGG